MEKYMTDEVTETLSIFLDWGVHNMCVCVCVCVCHSKHNSFEKQFFFFKSVFNMMHVSAFELKVERSFATYNESSEKALNSIGKRMIQWNISTEKQFTSQAEYFHFYIL